MLIDTDKTNPMGSCWYMYGFLQVHIYVCAHKYSCTLHNTLRVRIN